jgi:prefoldin subunit 5
VELQMNDSVEMIKDLAVHDVEIKHLQDDMDKMVKEMAEIKKSLALIQATLSEAKGGWKTLLMVGGAAATIGGVISWLLQHIGK